MNSTSDFFVLEAPPTGKNWWFLTRLYDQPGDNWHVLPLLHVPMRFSIFEGRKPSNVIASDTQFVIDRALADAIDSVCGRTVHFGRVEIYTKDEVTLVDTSFRRLYPPIGAGPRREDRGYHLIITPEYHKRDPEMRDGYGVHFDTGTWRGLHVFMLPNDGVVLISRMMKDAIVNAKIDKCRITPIDEYWQDVRDANVAMLRNRWNTT